MALKTVPAVPPRNTQPMFIVGAGVDVGTVVMSYAECAGYEVRYINSAERVNTDPFDQYDAAIAVIVKPAQGGCQAVLDYMNYFRLRGIRTEVRTYCDAIMWFSAQGRDHSWRDVEARAQRSG